MQVRNDYDKEVWNGDSGVIEGWTRGRDADGPLRRSRRSSTALDELDTLALAYAATVHKSQGSEYAAVVIPVHTQHYVMLQRNLLYTAVTRGKRLVRAGRHAQGAGARGAQRGRRRALLGPGAAAQSQPPMTKSSPYWVWVPP